MARRLFMGRTKTGRRARSPAAGPNMGEFEMEMTPMIDVTFLVLIFFMCTLKFKTLEGQLAAYLPKDAGVNPNPSEVLEPLEVGIHVRAPGTRLAPGGGPWSPERGGRFEFDADRRLDYSIGPRRGLDLDGLRRALLSLDLPTLERGVKLAAGPETVQGEAVEVLDLLMEIGVDEVHIRGAEED